MRVLLQFIIKPKEKKMIKENSNNKNKYKILFFMDGGKGQRIGRFLWYGHLNFYMHCKFFQGQSF